MASGTVLKLGNFKDASKSCFNIFSTTKLHKEQQMYPLSIEGNQTKYHSRETILKLLQLHILLS